MLVLTIPGLVMVLFSFFPTAAISFAGIEKDSSNSGDNPSVLNNFSTGSTRPENHTLKLEDFLVMISIASTLSVSFASSLLVSPVVFAQPTITDPSLKAELIVDGLLAPTSIAFLDSNNILLLEKEGNVRLISNGQLQPEPVLQLQGVESNNERGLL